MEQIFGYIDRITFQNPENGYTVAKLQQPRMQETTCIVGHLPALQPGETVRVFGTWKSHLVHGPQFEVEEIRVEAPADIYGIEKYLGSGLIKGIGRAYAGRIVEKFGLDTLVVIDETPERLLEVPGLGKKRVEKIITCWQEQKSIRDVMIFLQSHGVSPAYAQKIFKSYGGKSIEKVKENPYHLARDIFGIGFKMADKIAGNLGIGKTSPERIDAGIEYALHELSNEGNVCFPYVNFLTESSVMLEADAQLIIERIKILSGERRVVLSEFLHDGVFQQFIWNAPLYKSEIGIAKEIKRLLRGESTLRKVDVDKAIAWAEEKIGINLGPNQRTAVSNAINGKMEIITGGPGTGKSTITNTILAIMEKLTGKIFLAAPTGRAAKRMNEITGKKAFTIHSLLEFDFRIGGFKKNRDSPLDADLIIIDEASMIDTVLMYQLLKAIPAHARVIFVGDINQLPSVGPGNVLKDIIHSRCIPVTELHDIFRQAAGSRIVTNAHLINHGSFPDISNQEGSDFFFVEGDDPEVALQQILTLVTHRIPKKYRYNPIEEIQVLAPMKKGILGTENLNAVLQEHLNPNKTPLFRGGKKLSEGDKVMQIRNNYDKHVFNGDVGKIESIDCEEQTLTVIFDAIPVVYDFTELDEIVLAYAISVHKFQGSECPCVIVPVHTTHFKLLHRNLLYTAVTRGKKLVILVGSKKALSIAVRNDEIKKRFTGLYQALLEHHNPLPSQL